MKPSKSGMRIRYTEFKLKLAVKRLKKELLLMIQKQHFTLIQFVYQKRLVGLHFITAMLIIGLQIHLGANQFLLQS